MPFVRNAAKLGAGCSITSDPTLSLKNARDQTLTFGAILSSDIWESFIQTLSTKSPSKTQEGKPTFANLPLSKALSLLLADDLHDDHHGNEADPVNRPTGNVDDDVAVPDKGSLC